MFGNGEINMFIQSYNFNELFSDGETKTLPLNEVFTVHTIEQPGTVRIPIVNLDTNNITSGDLQFDMGYHNFQTEISAEAYNLSTVSWESELKRKLKNTVENYIASLIFGSGGNGIAAIADNASVTQGGICNWGNVRAALSMTDKAGLYNDGSSAVLTKDGYNALESEQNRLVRQPINQPAFQN